MALHSRNRLTVTHPHESDSVLRTAPTRSCVFVCVVLSKKNLKKYSVLSTQYSVLSTQYSVLLSTQYSVLSTQYYSVLSTQYSVTQYSVLSTQVLGTVVLESCCSGVRELLQ